MPDALRPSAEDFCAVYEKGFRTWFSLYTRAADEHNLPPQWLDVTRIFRRQPCFPRDLDLKLVELKHPNHGRLYATGISTWETSQGSCKMPSFEQTFDIPVSLGKPTSVSYQANLEGGCQSWFNNGDHLAVLILAWAYILSARWVEIMPGTAIEYADVPAEWNDKPAGPHCVSVDIGDACDDARRWWAAILAPGEGWHAYIKRDRNWFRSPWSVNHSSASAFAVRGQDRLLAVSQPAVSFLTATRFLQDYCSLHNAGDQSHAALAAALLLPFLNGNNADLVLPIPSYHHNPHPAPASTEPSTQIDHSWLSASQHLDKLLTLSCNVQGMRALLLSVFFEPGIACNLVSPWLQSVFAVLDRILGHILMSRSSMLAFVWLGAIITGIHRTLLREGRSGWIPIELHAAAWSETEQTFIQQPVFKHPTSLGFIRRSDECRLLFLAQAEEHTRVPTCQWEPFGATAREDTDIDVRLHADCAGHILRYGGWRWNCTNGKVEFQIRESDLVRICSPPPRVYPDIPVEYAALDVLKDNASENATRSIFGWLRLEGYPSSEKRMRKHEWLDVLYNSDEEQSEGDNNSGGLKTRSNSDEHVQTWIEQLEDEKGTDVSES